MEQNDFNNYLIQLVDKRNEAKYSYLRYILLLASGVLSVLISLNDGAFGSCLSHYLFNLSLLFLLLGILLGAFFLYADVYTSYGKVKSVMERQELQERGETVDKISFYKRPKIFSYCEKICYVCLIIAVISLVAYKLLN